MDGFIKEVKENFKLLTLPFYLESARNKMALWLFAFVALPLASYWVGTKVESTRWIPTFIDEYGGSYRVHCREDGYYSKCFFISILSQD